MRFKLVDFYRSVVKLSRLFGASEKRKFWVLIFLTVIESFLQLLSVGMVFPLLLAILSPEKLTENFYIHYFLENLSPFRGNDFIIFCLIFVIVLFIMKAFFSVFCVWFRIYFYSNLTNNVMSRLFKNYLSASYEFHINKNSSFLIRNLLGYAPALEANLIRPLGVLIESLIVGIPMVVFLTYLNPWGLLLMVCSIGLSSLAYMFIVSSKITSNAQLSQEAQVERNIRLFEGLGNIKETKILRKGPFFLKWFSVYSKKDINAQASFALISSTPRSFVETITIITVITMMVFMIFNGYPAEEIVIFVGVLGFASLKLLPLTMGLLHALQQLNFGNVSIDLLFEDLVSLRKQKKWYDDDLERTHKDFKFQKEIELKNITFRYDGSESNVLDQISLKIKKNQTVAFIGATGAGKTTLADVLIGLFKVSEGNVLVDKVDVTDQKIWTSKIGYVPQSTHLLDTSIKKNIAFGLDSFEIDLKRVNEVIKIAQLKEFVDTLPDKLESVIGEKGIKLSGGQRQRISIARALYHNPEILIFDEATSSLDNITEKAVMDTFIKLRGKVTLILIAHRLSTIKNSDWIYVLDKGKIIEEGTYSSLFRKSKFFKKLLEAEKKPLKAN